ncbi:MAG: DUF6364 family protein [Candidatus Neomarinimicrobiota bacterium]
MDKRITIYIDDDRYEDVKKIAEREDRSISNMIDIIFKDYILNYVKT